MRKISVYAVMVVIESVGERNEKESRGWQESWTWTRDC